MWALAGSTAPAVVFVVVTGLPVARALRRCCGPRRPRVVVLVTATLVDGGGESTMLYVAVPDPAEWWLDVFAAVLVTGGAEGVDPRGFEAACRDAPSRW